MLPRRQVVARILRISVPAAGETLVNATCQLWFLGLINRLGTEATAAHGVALRCEALAFLLLMSFSVSGGTLAGQYLGARRRDLADQAARTAWAVSVVVSCLLGLILYTQADAMMRIFLRDARPELIESGRDVLQLISFALPALATIQVFSGVLRGVGETRSPMLIALIGYLGVRIPLTYICTGLVPSLSEGYGLLGAWIAMFADLVARAVMIGARFLQGKWKLIDI
jgi:Na+-driven multidrug efflux pump